MMPVHRTRLGMNVDRPKKGEYLAEIGLRIGGIWFVPNGMVWNGSETLIAGNAPGPNIGVSGSPEPLRHWQQLRVCNASYRVSEHCQTRPSLSLSPPPHLDEDVFLLCKE